LGTIEGILSGNIGILIEIISRGSVKCILGRIKVILRGSVGTLMEIGGKWVLGVGVGVEEILILGRRVWVGKSVLLIEIALRLVLVLVLVGEGGAIAADAAARAIIEE
jgi:hypothetical protein